MRDSVRIAFFRIVRCGAVRCGLIVLRILPQCGAVRFCWRQNRTLRWGAVQFGKTAPNRTAPWKAYYFVFSGSDAVNSYSANETFWLSLDYSIYSDHNKATKRGLQKKKSSHTYVKQEERARNSGSIITTLIIIVSSCHHSEHVSYNSTSISPPVTLPTRTSIPLSHLSNPGGRCYMKSTLSSRSFFFCALNSDSSVNLIYYEQMLRARTRYLNTVTTSTNSRLSVPFQRLIDTAGRYWYLYCCV